LGGELSPREIEGIMNKESDSVDEKNVQKLANWNEAGALVTASESSKCLV
jgi:hypothetical protein